MKRIAMALLVLTACGSDLAPGQVRASGILRNHPFSSYEHAVFDIFDHDDMRRTVYVVLSEEANICERLQRGEGPTREFLVMGQNNDKAGGYTDHYYDRLKTRDTLLSGHPNYAGGVLHIARGEKDKLYLHNTIGQLNSHSISGNHLRGDGWVGNRDLADVDFNAKRCANASPAIRKLLSAAEYDADFARLP